MIKFTTDQVRHGSNLSITSTASRLTDVTYPIDDSKASISVIIRAPLTNTDIVWIGTTDNVTVGGTDTSTDGMPLMPGESFELPIEQPSNIYLITSSGTQVVYWISI